MLLELTRWLEQLQAHFGLFAYLTFRGILSALTALALSLWWGPAVIRKLALFKGGQPIRSDGPQTHFSKAGTPTMGGALILVTVLASVLLWGDLRNKYVWLVLAVMASFGAIGWYDDWLNIVTRDPNGMKSRCSRCSGSASACSCTTPPTYRRRPPSISRSSRRSRCRWSASASSRSRTCGWSASPMR